MWFQKYPAIHYLLISGAKIKGWVLLLRSLMCLDRSFMTVSITAWLSLQRKLAASHVLSSSCCIFAALKHCDVQSTAGELSVTVTMLSPSHPSFNLASSYASSWMSDIALFIKWNGAWNSEFSFVCMLTLAHNWLLERFLSHSVTLMICWLWWRENAVLNDQLWCYASQHYACINK